MNLDATSYGPLIKLVIALAVLAVLVLVVVFVALPLINARVSSGQPLFGNSPAVEPAKQTASPLNPILTNEVKTVQFGDFQRFFCQINTGDRGAGSSHAFCKDATTTSDIEHRFACEAARQIHDPVQPQWIDRVQGLEFAVRIPPA